MSGAVFPVENYETLKKHVVIARFDLGLQVVAEWNSKKSIGQLETALREILAPHAKTIPATAQVRKASIEPDREHMRLELLHRSFRELNDGDPIPVILDVGRDGKPLEPAGRLGQK